MAMDYLMAIPVGHLTAETWVPFLGEKSQVSHDFLAFWNFHATH